MTKTITVKNTRRTAFRLGTTVVPASGATVTVDADDKPTLRDMEAMRGRFVITDDVQSTSTGGTAITPGTLTAGSPVVVDANKATDEAIRVNVWNASGGTITAGTPIYLSAVHTNGKPKIVKADADAAGAAATHIVVADIANNAAGVVATQFLSPATLDTSGYTAAGDPAYLSETVGAVTPTAPTANASIVQKLGYVVVKNASTGQILWAVGRPRSSTTALTATGVSLTSTQNATTNGSDAGTTQTLANALKVSYNAAQVDIAALNTQHTAVVADLAALKAKVDRALGIA